MTQKEAVFKALEALGGRAQLKDIYQKAPEYTHFGGSQQKATIRAIVQRHESIRPSSKGKGWWELVSYQEEIDAYRREIDSLRARGQELVTMVIELKEELALPAVFDRLASECMNALKGQSQKRREEIVGTLTNIQGMLNIRISDETSSRLKKFADCSQEEALRNDYMKKSNETMERIRQLMETLTVRPYVGTIVMEQNNYGADGRLVADRTDRKISEL